MPDTPNDAHHNKHADVRVQEPHAECIASTGTSGQFSRVQNDKEIRPRHQPDGVHYQSRGHNAEAVDTTYFSRSSEVPTAESNEGYVTDTGGEQHH